jgi:hypothetical protein
MLISFLPGVPRRSGRQIVDVMAESFFPSGKPPPEHPRIRPIHFAILRTPSVEYLREKQKFAFLRNGGILNHCRSNEKNKEGWVAGRLPATQSPGE